MIIIILCYCLLQITNRFKHDKISETMSIVYIYIYITNNKCSLINKISRDKYLNEFIYIFVQFFLKRFNNKYL